MITMCCLAQVSKAVHHKEAVYLCVSRELAPLMPVHTVHCIYVCMYIYIYIYVYVYL